MTGKPFSPYSILLKRKEAMLTRNDSGISRSVEDLVMISREEFWTLFPADPEAFLQAVKLGIHVSIATSAEAPSPEPEEKQKQQEELHRRQAEVVKALAVGPPEPPTGYYWFEDQGGPMLGTQKTFRLWHRDLGYQPVSE